jgi:hypothetical protein
MYVFLIISHSFLIRMRNVSGKRCRENQSTHFVFSNFFFEDCAVYEILCAVCAVPPEDEQVMLETCIGP